ncbi:MAG: type 4a pilus biogenesis protein PilO [Halobacteriovoraceae bacterium]|nr:type 4a pilus biogenesis protein PilO [Halobacteriovoraceae bacterium]
MEGILDKIISKLHLVVLVLIVMNVLEMFEGQKNRKEEIQKLIVSQEKIIQRLTKEKAKITDYNSDIENWKEKINDVAERVENLKKKLPSRTLDTENQAIIKGISEKLNIRKSSIRPTGEIPKGFYFIKNYSFSGEGTFLQFLIFFEKIALSERLLNVSTLNFVSPEGRQKGRFQIVKAEAVIEAYRYNPSHKVDTQIEGLEKLKKK